MTNPKQSESDTEKNPWATANPNYKFGKSLLSDDDLKKGAPFTRKLHTFYMQCGKSDDNSQIWRYFIRIFICKTCNWAQFLLISTAHVW
jgi:hypothetical protein